MKELWKPILGYEDYYEISNLGRVAALSREVKMPNGGFRRTDDFEISQSYDKDGYMKCRLTLNGKRKDFRVHRLVCIAFLENPENKKQVNHINGIKSDNKLSNLEWCTIEENMSHTFKMGLKTQKGIKNNMSKLTDSDIINIRNLIREGLTNIKISKLYNVTPSNISCIRTGRTWSHIL